MDWQAAQVTLKLGLLTTLLLMPLATVIAYALVHYCQRWRALLEALILLPLLLPPTVVGFVFLLLWSPAYPLGAWLQQTLQWQLVFSFSGLCLVSLFINLPFMVQPIQRGFAAIPRSVREAAWVSGLSRWQTIWRIELPLIWPNLLVGAALTFAHTMGEFGVVLMVGGNISGQTRTMSIAIFDRVQALDMTSAAVMSVVLIVLSLVTLVFVLTGSRHNYLAER